MERLVRQCRDRMGARRQRDARLTTSTFPAMPHVSAVEKWTETNVFFKTEGGLASPINIGLGQGAALDTFNKNLTGFRVTGW